MKADVLETIEVRWFEPGRIPAAVASWFDRDCLRGKTSQLETRTDFYLYLPESSSVSCKWRQGNLELKWRQDEWNERKFGKDCWQGKVERWYKSIEERSVRKHQLDRFLPAKFWIGVSKKRRQRCEAGISGELAEIEIESRQWWSLAFEMNGSDRDFFGNVLDRVGKTYPEPPLSLQNCFAYPQLLATENFVGTLT